MPESSYTQIYLAFALLQLSSDGQVGGFIDELEIYDQQLVLMETKASVGMTVLPVK